MKNIIILFLSLITAVTFGQVENVDYLMKYNCETNQYDVSIVILNGSAISIAHRAQFNSQLSIVVPVGEGIVITNSYAPLQANQNYTGTIPLDWRQGDPIFSPAVQPENDFYSVTPKLIPIAFYNNLQEGDVVMLFSFLSGTTGQYNEEVRFFKNNIDPDHNAPGMGGANFSNGFTIGGINQIYNGHSEESCITDVNEEAYLETNIYPNPFNDRFTVELPVDAKSIQVIGAEGKNYYQSGNNPKGILTVNAIEYPSGIYFIKIETETGIASRRIIKI